MILTRFTIRCQPCIMVILQNTIPPIEFEAASKLWREPLPNGYIDTKGFSIRKNVFQIMSCRKQQVHVHAKLSIPVIPERIGDNRCRVYEMFLLLCLDSREVKQ